MLAHGFRPRDFAHSVLIPIPKNLRKSLGSSDNYRSIALSSILNKVLDKILLVKCKAELRTSDYQFGFKAKHATYHCSFVANEVITKFVQGGSTVYACLLDASKAFDRLEYSQLFSLLYARNICPLVLRLLLSIYKDQVACVRWGTSESPPFHVQNGVKQGGVLSPTLFSVYMDELLSRLARSGVGCHIGNVPCGSLAYADDVILLSPSLSGLRAMLSICAAFAEEYHVLFNATKSKLVVIPGAGANAIMQAEPLRFMGGDIEQVPKDKHLGILLGNVPQSERISALSREIMTKTNMVIAHFRLLPPESMYFLFKSFAMPLYGSQTVDLSSPAAERLCITWRKAIRMLLRLPPRTHSNLLPFLCNDAPVQEQLLSRFVKFFQSVYNSPNALTRLCARLALEGSHSDVSNSISHVASSRQMPRHAICDCAPRVALLTDEDLAQRSSVIADLLHARHIHKLLGDSFLGEDDIEFAIVALCCE
jgi:hypothetical protein